MNKVLGNKKAISLFVVPALIIYTIIVMVRLHRKRIQKNPGVRLSGRCIIHSSAAARDFSGNLPDLTIMQDFSETRTS